MKSRNQLFQYLKAILILMVIDDHSGNTIGFLSSIFPYNSFYIPLFVIISGYFYRAQGIKDNLINKSKRLLVPYLIWSIAGDLLAFGLMKADIVNWYVSLFSFRKIMYLLLYGPISSITGPAWFVIMLFWVCVIYNVLHRLLKLDNKKAGYAFLVISVIAGCISIWLCMKGYHKNIFLKLIFRTVWFIQFYHMGTMFRRYWEEHIQKIRTLFVLVLTVAVNIILICTVGNIDFVSTQEMAYFHSFWIPLITTVTASLFWYKIMQFISSRTGQIKAVSFLADNTFTIMCAHLFFLNIPNFFAYFRNLSGDQRYLDFSVDSFTSTAWMRYTYEARLTGFFCAVIGSCLMAYVIKYISKKIHFREY